MSHRALRACCRCAECEHLRRHGRAPTIADDIELQRIEPVGEIGLPLFFSDGHRRGIFPWAYLHELAFGNLQASDPALLKVIE
jgi:DUF971 family protein